MITCKNCKRPADPGHALCTGCLNNWLVVRQIISRRMQAQYGDATRETAPIIERETKRLDNLWKRNRSEFEKELNTWYSQPTE